MIQISNTPVLWLLSLQLSERQAGNKAYKQQQYAAALQHYQRARAVVNFVVGCSADEQAEVQANKATVLLNIAAVHMAQQVGCEGGSCGKKRLWHEPLHACSSSALGGVQRFSRATAQHRVEHGNGLFCVRRR
jgi:hypothetical protein